MSKSNNKTDFLDSLISICQSYYERVKTLENEKYDMEKEVEYKDYKVWQSNLKVPPHPLHILFLNVYMMYSKTACSPPFFT